MKKYIIAIAIGAIAGLAYAQNRVGVEYSYIGEAVGTTNYLGVARTTENTSGTPSTSDAVWKIIKTVTDASGNITSVKHAYGSGTGDNAPWSTAWTNRVNATYK